jgi:hypothetical protein
MYRVDWLPEAVDEWATLWRQADSALRKSLTEASHAVDECLSRDPLGEGESRAASQRIMFLEPLAVFYRIEPDGQTVTVLHVRLYPEP